MVRALRLLLCLLIILAGALPASADEVLDDDVLVTPIAEVAVEPDTYDLNGTSGTPYSGSIGSTYVDLAERCTVHLGIDDHYVFFRGGQYDYYLYCGDLVFSGTGFSGTDLDCYYFSTAANYNSYTTIEYLENQSLNLTVGDYLVYSDLGNYPGLYRDTAYIDYLLLYVIVVALICCFIYRIFKFTLRRATNVSQDS